MPAGTCRTGERANARAFGAFSVTLSALACLIRRRCAEPYAGSAGAVRFKYVVRGALARWPAAALRRCGAG